VISQQKPICARVWGWPLPKSTGQMGYDGMFSLSGVRIAPEGE
jgi:hypothetical protein